MNRDREVLARVAELDAELLPPNDDGKTVTAIGVPWHRFAGLEHESPD